ncbi:hypothetical protein BN1723_019108 [Verticillium longisporum]|uniref:Uncharacterized protein n=1 Tax=Verticillium longisporum TaxID=100787 RepID=A0A0G4N9J6_VERLO|nr:hypothetical protein BN1723_019108 [Verticillium longisporum]
MMALSGLRISCDVMSIKLSCCRFESIASSFLSVSSSSCHFGSDTSLRHPVNDCTTPSESRTGMNVAFTHRGAVMLLPATSWAIQVVLSLISATCGLASRLRRARLSDRIASSAMRLRLPACCARMMASCPKTTVFARPRTATSSFSLPRLSPVSLTRAVILARTLSSPWRTAY